MVVATKVAVENFINIMAATIKPYFQSLLSTRNKKQEWLQALTSNSSIGSSGSTSTTNFITTHVTPITSSLMVLIANLDRPLYFQSTSAASHATHTSLFDMDAYILSSRP